MDNFDCVNLCPGVDCPSECSGYSNAMSGTVGLPSSFTGGMFAEAQQNFSDWGGVTLAAALAIGTVLSVLFGR
ncbi:hypothetical protein [Coleofasciculus sp. G2-EDA-02]|uniref:hypothetical protein n=1 Tax=Coleofasciculus sp. G2-EDA-02 TaxID=3069529 RepID=UPI0032FFABC3